MSKYLITGLGNIGSEYAHSRHNIGFDVVSTFVLKHGGVFNIGRLAEVSQIKWKGKTFVCIKPTTYMNLSGKAFKYWMDKEHIALENTLTIVDDLALPLSKLRLRPGGSSAGHNGLKDIQAAIGTEKYAKLRFGIGSNYAKGQQVAFVLGKWGTDEISTINSKIEKCMEAIENFATIGLDRTMELINKQEII